MGEVEVIKRVVWATAKRWRTAVALRWGVAGFLAGSSLWLLLILIQRLFAVPAWFAWIGGVIAVASAAGGAIFGWSQPFTLNQAARWVDLQAGLQERLSSALELSENSGRPEWRQLVVADAFNSAKEVVPQKLIPFHLPKRAYWLPVVLLCALGASFLSERQEAKRAQAVQDAALVRVVGEQVAVSARKEIAEKKPINPAVREKLEALQELGAKLSTASLSREQAMKDVAAAAQKLQQETEKLAPPETLNKLREANRSSAAEKSSSSDAAKEMRQKIAQAEAQQAAMEKLETQMQDLQKKAEAMAQADPAKAEQMKKELAQGMAGLQQKAASEGLSIDGLQQAMEALQSAQTDKLVKNLKVASKDLEKMLANAKAMQQAQKAGKGQQNQNDMGKDLAERLEKGQGEAAVQRLNQMRDELGKVNLTEEQMRKLIDEMSRAAKPGSDYRKTGDFLKRAAQQAAQGDKAGSRQSLEDAAKELQGIMTDMADADAMSEQINSLERAQAALGSGNLWAPKPGRKPGAGKGGKPGAGVGTWADENNWEKPEQSDGWDNSGVKRPDMAAKGLTDRGPGQMAESVAPTRLNGQMNQGGGMPSITLKGVSIRGQSKVSFQEAAAAAQTEAQNALSSERVPRNYQNAVKGYFDDLPKP